MDNYLEVERYRNGFDIAYYWDQFHPILGALAIFILGWIIALAVAAGVKKLLDQVRLNQRLASSVGPKVDLERLISRIIFWFIFIIAIVAALNVLNIQSVSGPFSNMINQVVVFIPQLISAAIIALVGWLIATFARSALIKVLARSELDEKLSREVGVTTLSTNLADIVYWLVLLLFLPIVLSILGLNGLLLPVQNMVNEVVLFLPNLFIAAIIAGAGYIIAKIVRGIVEGLGNSLGLQQHVNKLGLFKQSSLPKMLGSLAFALIILTSLIVAFEALGIDTISQPATNMLNQMMYAIPNILAAGIILVLAFVIAKFVGNLVSELIAGTGADDIPAKLDIQRFLGTTKVSDIVGVLIVFFTMLFAVSEAANRLGFQNISDLIAMFIQFGANILLGAVILVIGFWLANLVAGVVARGPYQSSRWLANLVRVLIMGLVIAMGLRAMGIADSIVNLAFGLTLGSVAVAFALAFGLGGRAPAERVLNDFIDQAKEKAKQPQDLMTSQTTFNENQDKPESSRRFDELLDQQRSTSAPDTSPKTDQDSDQ